MTPDDELEWPDGVCRQSADAGRPPHALHGSGADQRFIDGLRWVIRWAVRVLAVLMTGVILFGVADVVYVLYKRLTTNDPPGLLQISDILATFGAFMAVLIAIEIFINIISYLQDNTIHIEVVLATALMAIARKVIVLDFNTTEPAYVYATAAVVVATAAAYWLVRSRSPRRKQRGLKELLGRRGKRALETSGPQATAEPALVVRSGRPDADSPELRQL